MSTERWLRVQVHEVQPVAFDGAASEPASEYEAHLEQYRAYLSGARWEPVPGLFPLVRGKTRSEVVKQAQALLRHWARVLA